MEGDTRSDRASLLSLLLVAASWELEVSEACIGRPVVRLSGLYCVVCVPGILNAQSQGASIRESVRARLFFLWDAGAVWRERGEG